MRELNINEILSDPNMIGVSRTAYNQAYELLLNKEETFISYEDMSPCGAIIEKTEAGEKVVLFWGHLTDNNGITTLIYKLHKNILKEILSMGITEIKG